MRPLKDIRVLDLSRLLPGPFATLVLADLGATVDKIEDPGQGDYLRHMPPQIAGANAAFAMLNRGKRSAVLDLKQPAARDALRKMLATYDVLFEQFRPGVLARLGLDIDALRAEHPRLIVCSLTGYGQTGPMRDKAGHDLNYLARAGILGATGPEGAPPTVPGFQLADISGGLWSVVSILAALRERDQTGKGAHLDVAMSEGTLPFMTTTLASAVAGSPRPRGTEELTGGIAPYAVYETSDGRYVSLAALEPKFWTVFATELGFEASLGDLMPGPHQVALREKIAGVFKQRSFAEWTVWASERDCLVEPVLAPSELRADPHLSAREIFFDLDSPRGSVPQVRTPVTPRDCAFPPPPEAGEHTRAVLREAGLEATEIDALLGAGAAR